MKYSRGPWKVVTDREFPKLAQIEFGDGKKLVCIANLDDELEMGDLELAASAPELLEALLEMRRQYLVIGSPMWKRVSPLLDRLVRGG